MAGSAVRRVDVRQEALAVAHPSPFTCTDNEGISLSLLSDAAVRHHRPLPDIPTSEDDSGAAAGAAGASSLLMPAPNFAGGGGGGGLDGSMNRWSSRENLLTAATDEDPQLFVSLYDFQAGGENQLSLKKGRDLPPPASSASSFLVLLLCRRPFQGSNFAF